MSSCLIGHTGFIGQNLVRQTQFTDLYHSKNIGEIEGRAFDLLVCSGVSAVKWWANKNAEEDRARIDNLLGHLGTVKAKRVYVISTVDVYPQTVGVDEWFDCHAEANHAYGTNRLYFEEAMQARFPGALLARIGGVFGSGLKKNLIYDLMHDNGLDGINVESAFQFYDVGGLWKDLKRMEREGLTLVNFVTEPVRMGEVVARIFPEKEVGRTPAARAAYDIRTRWSEEMGGADGYLAAKEAVLDGMERFVRSEAGVELR